MLFGRSALAARVELSAELAAGLAVELATELASGAVSIAGAGDLDGDGIGEVALGLSAAGADAGGAVLLLRGRREWPEVLAASDDAFGRIEGDESDLGLGARVLRGGDIDPRRRCAAPHPAVRVCA